MNIFLNHIYLVLSDKTYRSITGSDFLRTAFPGMERRTTYTAAGESWFGTYFYGFDNYIEFFSESAGHWQPNAARGWGGLAFSSDEPGGADTVQQILRENLGYEPTRTLRRFQDGSNWFEQVRLAEQLGMDSFDAWVMEYHPDVFAQRGLAAGPHGELTRQAYLAPYNHPRRTGPASAPGSASGIARPPVFKRVVGVDLCMPLEPARKLARMLSLLGYALNEDRGDLLLSAHGFCLRLVAASAAEGLPGPASLSEGLPGPASLSEGLPGPCTIRSLKLEMSRQIEAPTPLDFIFPIGSRLTINADNTADWNFDIQ